MLLETKPVSILHCNVGGVLQILGSDIKVYVIHIQWLNPNGVSYFRRLKDL